jgi:threonine aldolase
MRGIRLAPEKVVTNIVIFDVEGTGRAAAEICSELAKRNVLAGPFANYTIRMVTHYDVDRDGIELALAAMRVVTRS